MLARLPAGGAEVEEECAAVAQTADQVSCVLLLCAASPRRVRHLTRTCAPQQHLSQKYRCSSGRAR